MWLTALAVSTLCLSTLSTEALIPPSLHQEPGSMTFYLDSRSTKSQKFVYSSFINPILELFVITSRSERPVDQGGNNETALFFLSLSLADSAALSSTPRESSLSNCCRSRLSTRSISSFFLPNLSLFPPCYPVRLSLFISSSLPFDHGVCTTRADHNTRYPWRRVLSPFTQFVF